MVGSDDEVVVVMPAKTIAMPAEDVAAEGQQDSTPQKRPRTSSGGSASRHKIAVNVVMAHRCESKTIIDIEDYLLDLSEMKDVHERGDKGGSRKVLWVSLADPGVLMWIRQPNVPNVAFWIA